MQTVHDRLIKSPNWLIYKNSTINTKNAESRSFHHVPMLTQSYNENENHCDQLWNIKSFIDIYNWVV